MSVAPGKLASAPRLPLQDQTDSNIMKANDSKITETPIVHKVNYSNRITTPPGSIMGSKKTHVMVQTPLGKTENTDGSTEPKSVLLSPAFSSPQQRKDYYMGTEDTSANIDFSISSISSSSFSSDEALGGKQLKKKKKTRKQLKEQSFDFDSADKPPYSYATLIGMSILSNNERRLTLSQIYSWISDTFKYYKRDEVGWQNSIRHNLSLNKAFIKGEKSKDGKGHFWCIKEGCEEQFLKTRSNMKNSYNETMNQIYSSMNNNKETQRSINSIPSSPNASNLRDEDQYYSRKRISSEIDEAADYDNADDYEDGLGQPFIVSSNKKQKMSYNDHDNNNITSSSTIESHLESTPYRTRSSTTPLIGNTPHFIISESPSKPLLAGKNLAYTSSFSCNSNLELSPIRPTETGPLLEPLTPANNIYNQTQPSTQPSQQKSITSGTHLTYSHSHQPHHLQRTPKSNIMRTPLKLLRTPQTSSIMKKLWNSPSYLEEFYYSPLVASSASLLNSYDDDDMIMRNLESQHSPISLKRQQLFDSGHISVDHLIKTEGSPSQVSVNTRIHKISSSSTELDE